MHSLNKLTCLSTYKLGGRDVRLKSRLVSALGSDFFTAALSLDLHPK